VLLNEGRVLGHPFMIGELVLGNLRQRDIVLNALSDLPHANLATTPHFCEAMGTSHW
jgi:hypothetical protein